MNYIKGYNYELQIKYYIINQLNKKDYLYKILLLIYLKFINGNYNYYNTNNSYYI